MSSNAGRNKDGHRNKPAKYSSARVNATLGGWTKALEWHLRGATDDGWEDTPYVARHKKRPPKGGACVSMRSFGNYEGLCGLPESHTVHAEYMCRMAKFGINYYHPFKREEEETDDIE